MICCHTVLMWPVGLINESRVELQKMEEPCLLLSVGIALEHN